MNEQPIQLFNEWLGAKDLSPISIKNYLFYWDKFPGIFSQNNVDKFISKYRNPVARAYVRNLKEFILAHPDILESENPLAIVVPKIKSRKAERVLQFISEEDVIKMARTVKTERDALMMLICFYGGLRLTGLMSIKPKHFNWKKWWEDKNQPGELIINEKGNKERVVMMPNWIMLRLEKWIRKFARLMVPDPNKELFFNESGVKLSSRRFQFIVSRAGKKALGKHIHPHIFRHSCAMWLLEHGMPIEELQQFLGHKDISATQLYIHLNKDHIKSRYKAIQDSDQRAAIVKENSSNPQPHHD